MLRSATLILLGILTAATVKAQGTRNEVKEYTVSSQAQSLQLDLPFGQAIKLVGWDKPEVKFTATINFNGGQLNDMVIIEDEETSEEIKISMELDHEGIQNTEVMSEYSEEQCEAMGGQGGYWQWEEDGESQFICRILEYTIYVPKTMPLSLEAINPLIEIRGIEGPMTINSINGPVDVDWDTQDPASFSFQSIHGELFSDLDLEFDGEGGFGMDMKANSRGGGPKVSLETINGHIYLRKR